MVSFSNLERRGFYTKIFEMKCEVTQSGSGPKMDKNTKLSDTFAKSLFLILLTCPGNWQAGLKVEGMKQIYLVLCVRIKMAMYSKRDGRMYCRFRWVVVDSKKQIGYLKEASYDLRILEKRSYLLCMNNELLCSRALEILQSFPSLVALNLYAIGNLMSTKHRSSADMQLEYVIERIYKRQEPYRLEAELRSAQNGLQPLMLFNSCSMIFDGQAVVKSIIVVKCCILRWPEATW